MFKIQVLNIVILLKKKKIESNFTLGAKILLILWENTYEQMILDILC